jgi:hypothetical protein
MAIANRRHHDDRRWAKSVGPVTNAPGRVSLISANPVSTTAWRFDLTTCERIAPVSTSSSRVRVERGMPASASHRHRRACLFATTAPQIRRSGARRSVRKVRRRWEERRKGRRFYCTRCASPSARPGTVNLEGSDACKTICWRGDLSKLPLPQGRRTPQTRSRKRIETRPPRARPRTDALVDATAHLPYARATRCEFECTRMQWASYRCTNDPIRGSSTRTLLTDID